MSLCHDILSVVKMQFSFRWQKKTLKGAVWTLAVASFALAPVSKKTCVLAKKTETEMQNRQRGRSI